MSKKKEDVDTTTRLLEPPECGSTPTEHAHVPSRLIADLGWTIEEAAETRHRLAAFVDDWDDPAMDVYDDV